MSIPLNQPSKEIVIALINRDNGTSLSSTQVDLENVSVMSPGFARNTSVQISAIPGQGFAPSSKTVYYNRLSLSYQWRNTIPVAVVDDPLYTEDLLPSINNIYGLNITLDDVENTLYTVSPHKLIAKPGSFVWIGEVDFTVVASETNTTITLSEEFSDASPPGFVYDGNKDYQLPTNVLMYEMLTQMTDTAHPYNPGHFSLSPVTAISGSSSSVTLTSIPGSGFSGTLDVPYNRIPITEFITSNELSVSDFTGLGYVIGEVIPGTEVLSYLNNTYSLDLTEDEVFLPDVILEIGSQLTVDSLPLNYLTSGSIVLEFV